jgi:hypothetical protein
MLLVRLSHFLFYLFSFMYTTRIKLAGNIIAVVLLEVLHLPPLV